MTGLNTWELDMMLHGNAVTQRTFLGTYPACMNPKTKRTFYTFITNSEEHDKAGEHWNAWVVSGSTVTFFDSFSRDPRHKHFPRHYTEFIKKFDKVNFVSKRVQSTKSTYCGLFCMHFIYIMSLGLDVNCFLEDYSSNYDKNDDAVVGITQGFFLDLIKK